MNSGGTAVNEPCSEDQRRGETQMIGLLYTLAVIFFVLWVVGFLFAHVGGGLIHILLVLAIIAIVFNLVTGRRAV
jgi:hypothetical protein